MDNRSLSGQQPIGETSLGRLGPPTRARSIRRSLPVMPHLRNTTRNEAANIKSSCWVVLEVLIDVAQASCLLENTQAGSMRYTAHFLNEDPFVGGAACGGRGRSRWDCKKERSPRTRTPRRLARRVEVQRAGGRAFPSPRAGVGGTEHRPGRAARRRGRRREQKTALCDAGAGARSDCTAEPFMRLRRITTPSVQGVHPTGLRQA
jgi:hypothetical protein